MISPAPPSRRPVSRAGRQLDLFARIGAVTLPVILLATAVAFRLDARIGLPMWLRGGLFLGLGLAFGLALWGWFVLRPRRAVVALTATALAGLSIVLVPDVRPRAIRFIVPWYQPPPKRIRARIVVPSGDPVIRRGEPVTLTAYREGDSQPGLPARVELRPEAGSEIAEPLELDASGATYYRVPAVTVPLSYRFMVGSLASDWHTVHPVDPVNLTDDSRLTIRTGKSDTVTQPLRDAPDIHCERGCELDCVWVFNRRPVHVTLDWRPQGEPGARPTVLPLTMSRDGLTATCRFRPGDSGLVTLRMQAEHDYQTIWKVRVVVEPDPLPRWVVVDGLNRFVRDVQPQTVIPVDIQVEDNRGVEQVWVEIDTGGTGEPQRLTVPVADRGTKRVSGSVRIPQPDGLQPGDRYRVRLAATDHTDINPGVDPGDRVSYEPATGWYELRINPEAAPTSEQAIRGQHEQIQQVLNATTQTLDTIETALVALNKNSHPVDGWSLNLSIRLGDARQELNQTRDRWKLLQRDCEIVPDLHALTVALSEMDTQLLSRCERSFRGAVLEPDPKRRAAQFEDGIAALQQMNRRIGWLAEWSTEAAALRFARERLRLLSQSEIEESVADPQSVEAVRARQRDRLRTVLTVIHDTPALTTALRSHQRRELQQFAQRLRQLAAEQQQLDQVRARTRTAWQHQSLAAVLEAQQKLIAECRKLAVLSVTPVQIAGVAPFDPTAWLNAEQRLRQLRLPDTLIEQEKAARELDRIAVALSKAAEARSDTREAIRQLSLWQAHIHTRFNDTLLDDVQKATPLRQDEQALLKILEPMAMPHSEQKLVALHATAIQAVRRVVEGLRTQPASAGEALAQAETAIRTLAEQYPTRDDRFRITRQQLEPILRDYRLLTGDIERHREDTNRFARLKPRFDALTKPVQDLDLPGLEHRRTSVLAGLHRLASDVQTDRRYDVQVSIRRLQHQLDWLRQAVSKAVPDDDNALSLLQLQQQFLKSVESSRSVPGTPERQTVRVSANELLRQYNAFSSLPVLPILEDVRESAHQVVRAAPTAPATELIEKTRTITAQLTRLVDRLTGRESDLARAQELANRAAAVAQREQFAPRLAPTPQEASAARLELRALRSILDLTRSGRATTTREAVERTLAKLTEADHAERHPALYTALAQSTRQLADAMQANGDSTQPAPRTTRVTSSDPAESAPAGTLPQFATAELARQLAERQRTIRDQVSALHAQFAVGITPSGRDPFGERLTAFERFIRKLPQQSELRRELSVLLGQMRTGDPRLWETIRGIPDQLEGRKDLARELAVFTDGLPGSDVGFPDLATRQQRRQEAIRSAIVELRENLQRQQQLALPGFDTPTVMPCLEDLRILDTQIRQQQIVSVATRCQAVASRLEKGSSDEPATPARFPLKSSAEKLVQTVVAIRASVQPGLPMGELGIRVRETLSALAEVGDLIRTAVRAPIRWPD